MKTFISVSNISLYNSFRHFIDMLVKQLDSKIRLHCQYSETKTINNRAHS